MAYENVKIRRALEKIIEASTTQVAVDGEAVGLLHLMVGTYVEHKAEQMALQGVPDEAIGALCSQYALALAFQLGLDVAQEIEGVDAFERMMKDGGWRT